MAFSLIAALSKNRVIGKQNKLPWILPEDLSYFYDKVLGKTVIMGRNTYYSMGGLARGAKKNIVLSRNISLEIPGCTVMHSISDIIGIYGNSNEEIMIIGGAEIYEQFLPLASKMYLTLVNCIVDGDVYFPKWFDKKWTLIEERSGSNRQYDYKFLIFRR